MPLENRVNPFGETFVTSEYGTLMGNRGILHDDRRNIVKRWASQAWLICLLEYNDNHRTVMTPGKYTELFFLDEVTALAAGHRPCWRCQRPKYLAFKEKFEQVHNAQMKSAEMDRILHNERRFRYKRRDWKQTFTTNFYDVPDYAMIAIDRVPYLKLNDQLLHWTPVGYVAGVAISAEDEVIVLTPQSTVGVLRLGYEPTVHVSAE